MLSSLHRLRHTRENLLAVVPSSGCMRSIGSVPFSGSEKTLTKKNQKLSKMSVAAGAAGFARRQEAAVPRNWGTLRSDLPTKAAANCGRLPAAVLLWEDRPPPRSPSSPPPSRPQEPEGVWRGGCPRRCLPPPHTPPPAGGGPARGWLSLGSRRRWVLPARPRGVGGCKPASPGGWSGGTRRCRAGGGGGVWWGGSGRGPVGRRGLRQEEEEEERAGPTSLSPAACLRGDEDGGAGGPATAAVVAVRRDGTGRDGTGQDSGRVRPG